ncbi:MAG: hypothetical protein P4L69_00110, partial [Desulfosporosinus sp.]|nr:hypothetical protein [Desulfosporosinus sp.]
MNELNLAPKKYVNDAVSVIASNVSTETTRATNAESSIQTILGVPTASATPNTIVKRDANGAFISGTISTTGMEAQTAGGTLSIAGDSAKTSILNLGSGSGVQTINVGGSGTGATTIKLGAGSDTVQSGVTFTAPTLSSTGVIKATGNIQAGNNLWSAPASGGVGAGQGAYLGWNRDHATGRSAFMNQRGASGAGVLGGGFEWLDYDTTGALTSAGPIMVLDSTGNLTASGAISGTNIIGTGYANITGTITAGGSISGTNITGTGNANITGTITGGSANITGAISTTEMEALTAGGTLSIAGDSAKTSILNLGSGSGVQTINVGGSGTGATTINLGSGSDVVKCGVNLQAPKLQALNGSNLLDTTIGSRNTFVGNGAGNTSATGSDDTFLGYQSGYALTNSNGSVGVGAFALSALNSGSHTALGYWALKNVQNGNQCTAVGYCSLANDASSYNTAVGHNSMATNTTGNYNTALGYQAGNTITAGTNCLYLGSGADASSDLPLSNSIAIGYNAKVSVSNTIQLGNSNITNVNTSGAITAGGAISGTNIIGIGYANITGTVSAADPTANNHLTTKAYVDNKLALVEQSQSWSTTFNGP